MGGGGVQRWLKMSKYMKDFGWMPVIYTPLNADVANHDDSLDKEVPEHIRIIRKKIWEPFELYKRFVGKSKDEKVQPGFLQEKGTNKWMQMISVWIRGNLFIPDAKKFWVKPSIKFLANLSNQEHFDAVISTGPPHSNHLIAMGLKKQTGIKWLADFRDPWTNIDYYNKLMLSNYADKKHKKLEKKVFKLADEVVTVSWNWADDFNRITGRKPKVVTNGYDHSDFIDEVKYTKGDKLTFTHIGSLNKDRNPYSLWKAMSNLKSDKDGDLSNFKILLIGPTDISVFEELEKYELMGHVEHIENIDHKSVIGKILKSDVLLLPLNDTPNIGGVIPGKLYEYIASCRPILCIGDGNGDSAKIINETQSGHTFDFSDIAGIQDYLIHNLKLFSESPLKINSIVPEKYSRQNLAGEICKLLNNLDQD